MVFELKFVLDSKCTLWISTTSELLTAVCFGLNVANYTFLLQASRGWHVDSFCESTRGESSDKGVLDHR